MSVRNIVVTVQKVIVTDGTHLTADGNNGPGTTPYGVCP